MLAPSSWFCSTSPCAHRAHRSLSGGRDRCGRITHPSPRLPFDREEHKGGSCGSRYHGSFAKEARAMLFPTTLGGSYPQPDWLIDRDKLLHSLPPRVRAKELWRIPEVLLAEAQDDATVAAIKAQE